MSSNSQQVSNAPLQAGIPSCILAVIVLGALSWARKLVKYPYHAADFTLILGRLCAWAMTGIIWAERPYGSTRHTQSLAMSVTVSDRVSARNTRFFVGETPDVIR